MNEKAQAAPPPEEQADAPPSVLEEETPPAQERVIGVVIINYMKKKNVGIVINGQAMNLNHGQQTSFSILPGTPSIGIGLYDKDSLRKQQRDINRALKQRARQTKREASSETQ